MDWKETLGKLRGNPDLPQGEENAPQPSAPGDTLPADTLHVLTDRKGRKGKTATIVEGFTCGDEEVARVAAALKRKLGVGGSSRGGEILIQGDAAERVRGLLREMGYKVK